MVLFDSTIKDNFVKLWKTIAFMDRILWQLLIPLDPGLPQKDGNGYYLL